MSNKNSLIRVRKAWGNKWWVYVTYCSTEHVHGSISQGPYDTWNEAMLIALDYAENPMVN